MSFKIVREAEHAIGVDRVGAFGLQRVRAQLVPEADPPPLLPQVDDRAAPFAGDVAHREVELLAAVALFRAEHLARPALGVHAHRHRGVSLGHAPDDERDMLLRRH